jgi:hypothetical protein
MKPLSQLAIAELEIEQLFAGKLWAYVPVSDGTYAQWGLGIAVANERGYNPIPPYWCHGDNYNQLGDHADLLNERRGMSRDEVARIIASTMRVSNDNEPEEALAVNYA